MRRIFAPTQEKRRYTDRVRVLIRVRFRIGVRFMVRVKFRVAFVAHLKKKATI